MGWITSLGIIFGMTLGMYNINQYGNQTSAFENALYESLGRVTWSIALGWIIFACVHGYGGPVNWFLSWPQWQPLARLSYSIYIMHVPIQIAMVSSMRTTTFFSDVNMVINELKKILFELFNSKSV